MDKLIAWIIIVSVAMHVECHKQREYPHIVLIVADDVGWNDVGWNNPAINTPNLNTLAYEGIILNHTYTSPVCSPSRAALLTGKYPFRTGMQHGALKTSKPYGLPLKEKLLSEKLQQIGYETHMVGKWHLGFCNWAYTPTYRGFDTFYGFYTGQEDYFTHRVGKSGNKEKDGYDFRLNTKVYRPKKMQYSTTDFGVRAAKIIERHDRKKPMFLYLPFQAAHIPLQVPKRFEYQYAHIQNEPRRLFSDVAIEAMVSAMDEAVGMVADALIKRKMFDDTLIIFVSDNGGTPTHGGNNWPLRGGKGTLWEGGTRVPGFVWGNMLKKRGYVYDDMFHVTDIVPTIMSLVGEGEDKDLDGVSQWYSLDTHTPGPRHDLVYSINEISGRAAYRLGDYKLFIGSPGHYVDWYPPPSKRGRTLRIRKDMKVHHRGLNTTLLYNVKEDPIESNDLSHKYPHIVREMTERLHTQYWSRLVPALNPRKVRKGLPKFWDNVFSPGWC